MKLVYTVSQINSYIKSIMDNDFVLNNIHVEAEISNFKAHSSGHLYFTIKDENSSMNAVMFRSSAQKLKFMPENGMKVSIYGYISLYEKTGQYQLYAEIMEPSGIGSLYLAYERLKNRLETAGLFDERHKKPIPPYPKTIAVITSPTGAAVRDIIRISKRRNPGVKLVIIPALVQGENAPDDIVRAIRLANEYKKTDVIILGRGGGSLEDLWAFNDERVARAIFDSKIPVISAVGHETDFTISDFISDLRASTPSAAAEIAVKNAENLNEKIILLNDRLTQAMLNHISSFRARLERVNSVSFLKKISQRIYETEIYTEMLTKRLDKAMLCKTQSFKGRLVRACGILDAASPVNILKKGYALAYDKEGGLIKDSSRLKCGDTIKVKFNKGSVDARIIKKE